MLPYGLKIVWFCLSLSGLLCCCIVLIAFGRAVSNHWVPILYCSGCAVLQLAFCIGLAWQMNPFLMPRAFCLAQIFIIGIAASFLTGVCTAFSLATNLTVLKPKTWSQGIGSALMWHNVYAGPMILFPLAASIAQIAVSLKLNAIQPTDDLHCDASHPMWVRFLGYAGLPLLLNLPCLFITILSIYRVSKVQRHINRSFTEENGSPLTSLPRRHSRIGLYSQKSSSSPKSPGREPIKPGFSSPVFSARQFHLPFSPPPLDPHPDYFGSSTRSSTLDEPDSPASSSFPTFSCGDSQNPGYREPIDPGAIMNPEAVTSYEFHDHTHLEDWTTSKIDSPDSDKVSSVRWAHHHEDTEDGQSRSDFGSDCYKGKGGAEDVEDQDDEGDEGFVIVGDEFRYVSRRTHDRIPHISKSKTAPNLAPAIWRLILFQLLFTLVLLLASISTIIDVASRASKPTPFGTQHVALLLAAWGPAFFFAPLPAVRRQIYLMFSRSR